MRLGLLASTLAACAALALIAAPADAQTTREKTAKTRTAKKPPTRVTVQRRSYLNAGTEVYPYSQKYTDYALPVNESPFMGPSASMNTNGNFRPSGYGPFDLPAYHSPFSAW